MSSPEFTFIIPVHNGELYINTTIESILNQKLADFNLIVLENASTDNTRAVLRGCGDKRLHVISSDRLLSIQQNWARILDLSLTGFITISGHDDLFYPSFLTEIMDLIEAYPDASLYYSHFQFIDTTGNNLNRCKPIPFRETGDSFLRARQHLDRDMYGTGYVTRFADYKAVGGFPDLPGLYFADELLFYRLAQISEKICSPETLFAYRYHRQSASFSIGLEPLYEASMAYWQTLSQTPYFQSAQNKQFTAQYIARTFSRRYHRFLLDLLKSGDLMQVQDYKVTGEKVINRAKNDQIFNPVDSLTRMLDLLLYLPTRRFTPILTALIERGARLTQGIRK